MNITLEQYNTVVDGLRTQLELHRAFNNEITLSRDRFKEAYTINLKQSDKVVKAFQQEKEEQSKQLEQLKSENFNLSKDLNYSQGNIKNLQEAHDKVNSDYAQLRKDYSKLKIKCNIKL